MPQPRIPAGAKAACSRPVKRLLGPGLDPIDAPAASFLDQIDATSRMFNIRGKRAVSCLKATRGNSNVSLGRPDVNRIDLHLPLARRAERVSSAEPVAVQAFFALQART